MLKRYLKASEGDGRSLPRRLVELLLSYRITSHATANCRPGDLFLKRPLRTKFDILSRSMKGFVEIKQVEQMHHHNQHTKLLCLFPGSPVMVRNYHGDDG